MTSKSASNSQQPPYALRTFSERELFAVLSNKWLDEDGVRELKQARYLAGYLQHFETKTIIVEEGYVDRDYLDDYSAFYVRSHQPYAKHTKRMHFFNAEFTESEIASIFAGENQEHERRLVDSYIGFCVARPLPGAVIGRTVLRTYEIEDGRAYPVTRNYHVNLFGIPLSVKNSLAFQQQDTVVAACATVALWSAFHKTQVLFESTRPSPAQVTREAVRVRGSGRDMPSRELSLEQINQAIVSAGLEPEYIPLTNDIALSSLMYGYLSMGIPVMLLVYLRGMGGHAMTVTGYHLPTATPALNREPHATSVAFRARSIDRIYAHDDNIGPFAFVRIADVPDELRDPSSDEDGAEHFKDVPYILKVVWHDEKGLENIVDCAPVAAVIPLDSQIRLTFIGRQTWLESYAEVLRTYASRLGIDFNALSWDVRLQPSNELKNELHSKAATLPAARNVLLRPYPKYIWRATVLEDEEPLVDIFADASEVDKAFPLLQALYYRESLGKTLSEVFQNADVRATWSAEIGTRFINFLAAPQ